MFNLRQKRLLNLKDTKATVPVSSVMLLTELRSVTQISLKAHWTFASPSLMLLETHMNTLRGEWGGELAKHFHIWFWNSFEKELTP